MSLINVQNLTFGYGAKTVFENVSFQIDTDWKLGFVGRNGRGKTTFLNLLRGKFEYSGKISASVKFTYFPCEVGDESRLAYEIISEICTAEDWEIIRELSCLGVEPDVLYRPFDELSGGERTKLLLAALFLNEGDFLLIDEPTNHLDAAARQTVSGYLRRKKGFILVSHDRAFLDGCVDHILSINRTDIEIQSGNFSCWLDGFEKRQAFEAAKSERLKKDVEKLSESARRTAGWADKVEASKHGKTSAGLKPDRGFVGHKSAKMMKRAKVTEARQLKAVEEKSALLKNAETGERLKIFPLEYKSERLLSISDLGVFYGNRGIFGGVSLEIARGERVALDGKNGCGKSSLLKLIAGLDIPHSGNFARGSNLIVSYVPQTTDGLCGRLSDFAAENNIDGSLFMAILSKMDLGKEHADGDISAFSKGQKKKVLIAKSLCERAHLYVWDEPLNYIDIYSRLQIENLLLEFEPTMIFVEHDKSFRDKVATRIFNM